MGRFITLGAAFQQPGIVGDLPGLQVVVEVGPRHQGAAQQGQYKDPAHKHLLRSSGDAAATARQASGVRRQGASLTSLIWISGWLSV